MTLRITTELFNTQNKSHWKYFQWIMTQKYYSLLFKDNEYWNHNFEQLSLVLWPGFSALLQIFSGKIPSYYEFVLFCFFPFHKKQCIMKSINLKLLRTILYTKRYGSFWVFNIWCSKQFSNVVHNWIYKFIIWKLKQKSSSVRAMVQERLT